jgi:3-phytase
LKNAVIALLAPLFVGVVALPAPAGTYGSGGVLAVTQPTGDAGPTVETVPVASRGDAADDPAIWRNPDDPGRSIVIGNDKGGALEVYDLSGARIQRLAGGFYGNVDTRSGFVTVTGTVDIAVAVRLGVRVYRIDPTTRQLVNMTDTTSGSIPSPIGGEGLCLYRSRVDGAMYVFINARDGRIAQIRLQDPDADGLVDGTVVRQWDVGSEVEGCVADDELGSLYISEEDVGIWKYGAEPTAPTGSEARVAVDRTIAAGGHIRPDAEGLTIVYQPGGTGYLIASSQAASDTQNSYLVYERQGANTFIREFRVVPAAGIADGCGRTDGIDALAADLGPAFPNGIFVCQDNKNTSPGSTGNQNFKFVPLERVVGLSSEPLPNQEPTAVLSVTCTALTCHADGSDSTDAEGPIAGFGWEFGDGGTATGPEADHTYDVAGTYTVSLNVTDGVGATGHAEQVVSVSEPDASIAFVGASTSNINSTVHRVTVPPDVRPGDGLFLFFATNTAAAIAEPTGVTGWQPLSTVSMSGATTRVWRKVAGATDAGRVLQISVASGSKGNLVLLAYRGTSGVDPVEAFSAMADASGRSIHISPVVSVSAPSAWVISYWTHKDSSSTLLTPPAGVVVRANGTQTGSGTVKGLVVDSGGPVALGPYGGLTATAGAIATNATMWTIVLAAG